MTTTQAVEAATTEAALREYPVTDPYSWTGSVPRGAFAQGFRAGVAWAAEHALEASTRESAES